MAKNYAAELIRSLEGLQSHVTEMVNLGVPKEKWDEMTEEERELIRAAQKPIDLSDPKSALDYYTNVLNNASSISR